MRRGSILVFGLLAGLALGSSVALADARADNLKELVDVVGVGEAFDAARDMVRQQARSDADKGMASLLTRLDASPEVVEQLRQAYGEFIDEVTAGAMNRDQMAAIWIESYGANFTDDELKQLLGFYQSPLGKKAVAAARIAMPKVMQKMQAELQPRLQPAVQRYTVKVQKVIADCHCERKAVPAEK